MQQKLRRHSELAALYQVVMSSSACSCAVRVFLVVLVFYGVCGHNIESRDAVEDKYAVLTVARFNLALLLDIRHRFITVRVSEDQACYILSLMESLLHSPLGLIVHIYRQGSHVIRSEFRVQSEVDVAWLGSTLGGEHIRFCLHYRTLLLRSAADVHVNRTTQEPSISTDSWNPIG